VNVGSQIFISFVLGLQVLAMITVISRSERRNERNVNAVALLFVSLALFLLWT
jgi:hypothetical protein